MADTLNEKTPTAASKKFVRPPAFYDSWQLGEGIPVYKVFHVEDMRDVQLKPWDRFGCNAAFVNLADPFITSSIILELPPGGTTKVIRHMFETWCFIVEGDGAKLRVLPVADEDGKLRPGPSGVPLENALECVALRGR